MGRPGLLVAVLLVVPLLAGCSGGDSPAKPATTPAPTPIGKLDAAAVRLARATFCDRVPDADVRLALGAKAESHDSWGNGDPIPDQGSGTGETGHELGCAWTGAAGAAARAWVFARPVTAAFAGTLVHQAGQQPGCTAAAAPTFGAPALLQTCTLADGTHRERRAGLFGDTWLTCELSGGPTADLAKRTDRWCAAVVSAVRTG